MGLIVGKNYQVISVAFTIKSGELDELGNPKSFEVIREIISLVRDRSSNSAEQWGDRSTIAKMQGFAKPHLDERIKPGTIGTSDDGLKVKLISRTRPGSKLAEKVFGEQLTLEISEGVKKV